MNNSPRQKYDLLLFDLDQTLLDFSAAEKHAYAALCATFHITDVEGTYPIYERVNRKTWAELEQKLINADQVKTLRFERFAEELNLTADPIEMSAEYLLRLSEDHTEIPGAIELIKDLSLSYRLGLVTNGLSVVQHPRITNSGLRPLFEGIFISEDLGVSKPSKEYFDVVFRIFEDVKKDRALIVGDSLNSDIKGGLDYGIDTCWIDPKNQTAKFTPTYQISDVTGLREVLIET